MRARRDAGKFGPTSVVMILGIAIAVATIGSADSAGALEEPKSVVADGDLGPKLIVARVGAALAGPAHELERAILDIFLDVRPGEVSRVAADFGQVAEEILTAAQSARVASRTAVARILARYVFELRRAGRVTTAEAIVAAFRHVAVGGNETALEIYQKIVSAALTIPSGPVGSGLNTRTVSAAE